MPCGRIWTVLNPLVRKGEGSSGGIQYGISPNSGVRHIRYAFKESVPLGTVFSARGGTKPSVLKPAAAKAESVKGLVPISFEMP